MRSGFRVFDAHCHIGTALHSGRRHSGSMILDQMDRHGVDRALAIPFPAVASYREEHDEIGAAVVTNPDRLVGAVCVNPFVGESAFREEARRCREQYGFRALKIQPQFQGVDPLSERFDFVCETALENDLALVCHTGSGVPYALPASFMLAARKYPQLKVVLAHAGGGGVLLPDVIVAALFCPNIYLELSTLMPNHVLQVLSRVPADRLMVGSDLPENLDVEIGKIEHLNAPEETRRAILWTTACAVFGVKS